MQRMRGSRATTWWAWAFLFGRGVAATQAIVPGSVDARRTRRAAWIAYFEGMSALCANNAADHMPFSRRTVEASPADAWLCGLARTSRLASKLTEAETDWCADLVVRGLATVDGGVVKITRAGKAKACLLGVAPVHVRLPPGPTSKGDDGEAIEADLAPPLPAGDVAPARAPPPPKAKAPPSTSTKGRRRAGRVTVVDENGPDFFVPKNKRRRRDPNRDEPVAGPVGVDTSRGYRRSTKHGQPSAPDDPCPGVGVGGGGGGRIGLAQNSWVL